MLTLRGYLNPTGRLPAAVIPVWAADDAGPFLAAFRSQDRAEARRELTQLTPDAAQRLFRLPPKWADASIAGLSPQDVGMFALTESHILAFSAQLEYSVFRQLLLDAGFASEDPFTRLSLAKEIGETHLIASELAYAATCLLVQEVAASPGGAKRRVDAWLTAQRECLLATAQRRPAVAKFAEGLPATVDGLAGGGWARSYVQPMRPMELHTLHAIEDRLPSPKYVAVLNLEPVAPDKALQDVMIRHLRNGTQYLFFHAPATSRAKLRSLRSVATRALNQAATGSKNPFNGLVPPPVGDVNFFQIDRQWTQSCFVFYVDASGAVNGYRGQTPGVPMSEWYEELPGQFASELLEALMANAPTQVPVEPASQGGQVFDLNAVRRGKGS